MKNSIALAALLLKGKQIRNYDAFFDLYDGYINKPVTLCKDAGLWYNFRVYTLLSLKERL